MMLTVYLAMLDTEAEKQSFEKIYEKYKDRMIGLAFSILKDEYYAEEALDDAFVAIAKTIHSLPQDDELHESNYIYKVVRNAAIRVLKKNNKSVPLDVYTDLNNISNHQTPLDNLIDQENVDRISDYIKGMPEDSRNILMMRFFHNMSYVDISVSLGINLNTVRTKLKRGTAILQERIEGGYGR